ncbi:DUF1638 domain-containing protein [Pelagicoccus mobilis]|uniref:DUF1638 domain-containing protein n=1 Tax=Pelagicoccus mobilis TaxID=415221 RepID=A0A934RSH6_9BACT|nr:DUF1638 domain-containing protein [Pelagicoccus mobilis]MBK1875608.1 DUF1638 domain-containing protein [Pelagicoccus mobilis]
MSHTATNIALLSCDVFQDEIEAYSEGSKQFAEIETLEMGLHDNPDRLRSEITAAISRIESNPEVETILLAYGLCGNGLTGIEANRCTLVIPRAHDCISILLGGMAPHRDQLLKNPGTYFYSPGWIRGKRVPGPDREKHIRTLYAERFEDDEEMIDELVDADRDAFRHYNCAAYVDITNNQTAESYCKSCAQHQGWTYKRMNGNPAMLQDLLSGNWDPSRYLHVPPGKRIVAGDSDEVFQIEG